MRTQPGDTVIRMLVKLADGVPSAVAVMNRLMQHGSEIDPDGAAGARWRECVLRAFDDCGVYGSDIRRLHADVCDGDLAKTLAVIRAGQLGVVDPQEIRAALWGRPIDHEAILGRLRELVPGFGRVEAGAAAPGQGCVGGGVAREVRKAGGSFVRYDADGKVHCGDGPAGEGPGRERILVRPWP